ncbi:MAG: RsmB/NOP family class I SAM-dependent RNA methyltransferase [Coleofasciculaceae cyanobacterium SM2_3_26]|nr:RsmB/NOP family class I SAM-dependent RNA methyltransferase [Coleofasciculaceae cyanobacterium SM2_3_26]
MDSASRLLGKLGDKLFADVQVRRAWLDAMLNPQPFHPCILWCQEKPDPLPFAVEPPLPWQPAFVDRLELNARPGKHPLHNTGSFYCLDFSSVFAASVLLAIPQPVPLAIDLCAAPGGKSLFAWVGLQPEVLISNEVIGKRTGMLVANLKRCGARVAITNRDTQVFATEIPDTATVVLVDAPCTGQSLLAKGERAPGCFHPALINKNANRQKRILANAARVVAPGSYLAYMTCAYSPSGKTRGVCQWLLKRFPEFQPLPVPHLAAYQSHLTDIPCYRMFPQERLGAGAFTVLLQRQAGGAAKPLPVDFLERYGVGIVQ